MFLLLLFLFIATVNGYPKPHNIPVHFNSSWDGRDPRAVSWCSIVIIPSHLGLSIWEQDPREMVSYYVLIPVGWISESVQITTATNSSKNYVPLIIQNATSKFDGTFQSINITLSWADMHPRIYIGLINPQHFDPRINPNPLPKSGYCDVYDVKYGPCANWFDQIYNKKCRS